MMIKRKAQNVRRKVKVQSLRLLALSFSFTLCALSFTFISGCAKREIKNINSKGKNIICFGDSLTFGYGAEPGSDYPKFLSEIVSMPVINAGVDGDTTRAAFNRLDMDVLSKDPFLVVVEFGGNDFLKKIPLDETVANIGEIVEQIQSKGAIVAIADVSSGLVMEKYRHLYKRLAYQENCIFIPSLLGGILTNPSLKSDFIHPNANGYKMIAARVHRAIQPYLDKN